MGEYVALVRRFSAAVLQFHGAVAERFGLHGTDLKALRLLAVQPLTASAIAEATGLTNAAATKLVDRLETGGYVRRERDDEDRRRVTVRLIPSAVRELELCYAGQGSKMVTILAKFDERQFDAVLQYLEGATRSLTEEIKELAQRR